MFFESLNHFSPDNNDISWYHGPTRVIRKGFLKNKEFMSNSRMSIPTSLNYF